ncbi:MAG: methionyl-tRNA formyltransferase, partial [Planctomycetes bacterium]|nr:methionyl-tRNA formyltransferase [Planctomycetota bacterium]
MMATFAAQPLKIVVMGTGPFAVPMFQALLRSSHAIAAVVTRPTHAAAGRRPPPNPMRDAAVLADIPVLAPERVNDPGSIAEIAAIAPDLLVVCDYGQLLSPQTLAVSAYGGVNLHGSLLPRWRGAAPIQRALMAGDRQTGVQIMRMSEGLDEGAIL